MSVTICQSMGFVVSALGIGGIIASTCMDQWSTQDLYNNPVTAVFNYQGLWRTCVRESSGFTECRGYFTILGLPGRARPRRGRKDGRREPRARHLPPLSLEATRERWRWVIFRRRAGNPSFSLLAPRVLT